MENLLSVEEVSAELKVHRQTVYLWIKDGLLTSIRLGRKVIRVKRSDLEKFVLEHTEKN
jgi:excisionase family DNA binding protein